MFNDDFNDYKIYMFCDVLEFQIILVESYEFMGFYGVKSVSEISINGSMFVIFNVIYDVIGV